MSTTGSTLFNMDFTEVAEEAWERAGREMRSGYDLRTARRSMNLMTIEWQSKGINMWTMEQGIINLTPGLATYALPTNTIDLLEHVIRTGSNTASTQADLTITRISVSTYATIPNKLSQGRPIQVWIQRMSGAKYPTGLGPVGTDPVTGIDAPKITVWPTPDGSQPYQFVYWRLRRINDSGDGVNTQDIPFRFIPCMVAGLAYYLSIKLPGVDPQRVAGLKADYEQQFQLAAEEDREKAPVRFVPRRMFIGGG